MTTLHIPTHAPATGLPRWGRPVALAILMGIAVLLLRLSGAMAPDLSLPLTPFVVPGGPDVFATTA